MITLIIIAMLFMQATSPTYYLGRTVTDPDTVGQIDLAFDDGTVWALTLGQGCETISADQEVVWLAANRGAGTISALGSNDLCWVQTTTISGASQ